MKRPACLVLNALLACAAMTMFTSTPVSAQGNGNGGGGGGGTGGGTIYFAPYNNEGLADLWSMNSDGSNKTFLSSPVYDQASISRNLHAGQRWLVEERCVPGEWPHASGYCRVELFAAPVNLNPALTVQLTDDPSLEIRAPIRWMAGDSAISFVARRWENGQVVGGGVYIAALLYDAEGNIAGVQPPADPAIPFNLVMGEYHLGYNYGVASPQPDLVSFDWAPDGSRLVYDRLSQPQLRIATLAGQDALLATSANSAVWSPDNTKIAFNTSNGIETISPNGSGRKTILKWSVNVSVYYPEWSPTGTHLIYFRWDRRLDRMDLYRATSGGGSSANLTGDLQYGFSGSYWWR